MYHSILASTIAGAATYTLVTGTNGGTGEGIAFRYNTYCNPYRNL